MIASSLADAFCGLVGALPTTPANNCPHKPTHRPTVTSACSSGGASAFSCPPQKARPSTAEGALANAALGHSHSLRPCPGSPRLPCLVPLPPLSFASPAHVPIPADVLAPVCLLSLTHPQQPSSLLSSFYFYLTSQRLTSYFLCLGSDKKPCYLCTITHSAKPNHCESSPSCDPVGSATLSCVFHLGFPITAGN